MGKRLAVVLALATVACTPDVPACKASCGIAIYDTDDCPGFEQHHADSLVALEKYVGWPQDEVCKSLQNWQIRILETQDGWWQDEFGRTISGRTHFWNSTIELGSDSWGLNAYTHEIAHVYEGYTGAYREDEQHYMWDEKGIHTAIQKTRL